MQITFDSCTWNEQNVYSFVALFSSYSGKYKALVGDKHIHTYNNSGSFGELALLYNMPR